jgi:hypothetical protein
MIVKLSAGWILAALVFWAGLAAADDCPKVKLDEQHPSAPIGVQPKIKNLGEGEVLHQSSVRAREGPVVQSERYLSAHRLRARRGRGSRVRKRTHRHQHLQLGLHRATGETGSRGDCRNLHPALKTSCQHASPALRPKTPFPRTADGWCRRKAPVADRDHERRKWAGKRPFPGDTDRRALRSEVTHSDALPVPCRRESTRMGSG